MSDIARISSPFLEKLPLAVMIADVSGCIVYGNPRARHMTGHDAAELGQTRLGRLFPDSPPPVDTGCGTVDVNAPYQEPSCITAPSACGPGCRTMLRRRDGLSIPVRLCRESISWEGARYELLTLQDRREEERLREEVEISKLIVHATDRGILTLDPHCHITHANRAITTLLGMERTPCTARPSARSCPAGKVISKPCASSTITCPGAPDSNWTYAPAHPVARNCGCAARSRRIMARMAR